MPLLLLLPVDLGVVVVVATAKIVLLHIRVAAIVVVVALGCSILVQRREGSPANKWILRLGTNRGSTRSRLGG